MNVSEMNDFRDYVEEQRHLCYGVEGGTPGVHGRIARQYDFLLETIDTYQEINQPQLNENQKLLLEDLKNIKESHEDKNMLGLIWVLGQRFTNKSNIKSFTDQEILVVLQALEQEEE